MSDRGTRRINNQLVSTPEELLIKSKKTTSDRLQDVESSLSTIEGDMATIESAMSTISTNMNTLTESVNTATNALSNTITKEQIEGLLI